MVKNPLRLIPRKLTYNRFFRDHMHLSWNAKEMVQAQVMCLLSSRSCVRIAAGSQRKKEKSISFYFYFLKPNQASVIIDLISSSLSGPKIFSSNNEMNIVISSDRKPSAALYSLSLANI